MHRSDKGQVIYLILKGKVKVILSGKGGKEVILNTLESGNYFGEMSLFDRMPRSATVVTMEESEFLVISPEAITDQIKENPLIALKLLSEMSRRLREADEQINNLALLDVRGRIARVLVRLSRGKDTEQSENLRKIPRPSTKEIAAMSGTSRETVSRILSDFSKGGMIGLTKKNIYIFNALGENIDFQ